MVALGHSGFIGDSGGAWGGCMDLGFDLWRITTILGLGFEEDKVAVWVWVLICGEAWLHWVWVLRTSTSTL